MKNKVCCWVLAIFGVFLFLIVAGSGLLMFALLKGIGSEDVAVKDGSYIVMEVSGRLDEHRTDPHIRLTPDRSSVTLSDAIVALEHARNDDRIRGVVLKPYNSGGFAGLRELREALREFKTSGKPVYSYLEVATDRDYYLSSIADTIVMVPSNSGGMVMLGLSMANTYWAGTLEKLGLKFNVLHVGDFKGAYENFERRQMSDSLRLSLQTLLDGMFDTYVSEIVADRPSLTRQALERDLLQGEDLFISGNEALLSGYVDLVTDWTGLRERLQPDDELKTVSVRKYARAVTKKYGNKEIAVVFAEGGIIYGPNPLDPLGTEDSIEPERFVDQLRELREDENVAAVVLRVNSPGGSALSSDLILQEVKRLKAEKPVVVSMGNVAASGGYYISCAANHIVAQPNTITGSIGVVSVIPTAEGLYKKIDARIEVVEKGKWGQFIRFDKNLNADQKRVLMGLMDGVYSDFVQHVAEGRGMSIAEVEAVASGRVWTGTQALERRLVDEIGGLDVAIRKAADLASLSEEETQLRYYPKEEDVFTFLARRFGVTLRATVQHPWLTSDELRILQAAEYLREFFQRRDFVQMLAPLDLDF